MVYCPYFPQNAVKIHDSTVAQNIEDVDRAVTKRDAAEKLWAIHNLPSEYHPSVFDKGPYLRDETWMQFVRWRMACEEDHAVKYVEPVESLIYVIPTEGRFVFYNKGGLRMANAGGIINFRDVGVYLCKAHNLQKRAEDFMTSPEGYELAIEHPDLLRNAPSIDWIVIGRIPGSPNAIYGVAQVSEDSALLFGNVDSYKMEAKRAMREGMDIDALIRRGMGEEFLHLIRRGEATVQEEIDVRLWLIDMYGKLAERALDDRTKEGYMKMVRHLEKDLSTVRERYSKTYSRRMESLVNTYMSDPGKLELILEAEARLEYGLTEEADVKDYVESRLEEIAEVAENGVEDYEAVDLDTEMSEYEGGFVDGEVVEEAEACAEAAGGDGGEVCESAPDGGGGEGE